MKVKKIIAGIIAVILIFMVLSTANSLVGNPISKMLAVRSAREYVANEYATLNLEIESSSYNFKFNDYWVFFRSTESYDTAFSVHCDSFGNITGDEYSYEVANNFTTYRRIESELREIGSDLLMNSLRYNINNCGLLLGDITEDEMNNKLHLDMVLDVHNPPHNLEAFIYIDDPDITYDKMAEVLREMATLFDENDIPVSSYSIEIRHDALVFTDTNGDEARENQWISIYGIPAETLQSYNLAQHLEQLDKLV